jgi:hypothetical protein
LSFLSVLERGEVRSISFRNLADLAEGGDGLPNNTTGFGITDGLFNLDEARKEFRKEGANGDVRVDELGHVVNDTMRKSNAN